MSSNEGVSTKNCYYLECSVASEVPLKKGMGMAGNKNNDNIINDKEWLDLTWKYFDLMSHQRLEMISFYIKIEIVLFGGLFTLLQLPTRMHWAEYSVSVAVIFMSILFWGIDYRTKTMIHKCEHLIEKIESEKGPSVGEKPIAYINKWESSSKLRMTYSRWFRLQFIVIGVSGAVILFSLIRGTI